jgi:hypothetical protein
MVARGNIRFVYRRGLVKSAFVRPASIIRVELLLSASSQPQCGDQQIINLNPMYNHGMG